MVGRSIGKDKNVYVYTFYAHRNAKTAWQKNLRTTTRKSVIYILTPVIVIIEFI